MGKKKVSFINKKSAVTYRLIDQNDVPPNEEPKDVKMDAEKTEDNDEMEERTKFGIYFDDDYDYMKHMKARNEPITTEGVEKIVIALPKNAVKEPEIVIEKEGREIVAPTQDLEDVDPEIAKALENSEGEEGELEDDFITLAGGAVEDKASSSFIDRELMMNRFRTFRERKDSMDSDDMDSDQEQDDGYLDSDDDDYPEEEHESKSVPLPQDRNEGRQFMDDKFEKVLEEYDEERIGDGAIDEDVEGFLEPNSNRFEELVAEYQSKRAITRFEDLEKPDEEIKRKTLEMAALEDSRPEETVKIKVDRLGNKRNRWDCESILSTYSNLYNHPTLISEPPKKKKNGISKKDLKDIQAMDDEVVSMTSRTSVSTYRPKDETAEERRARKSAIKEERRERRQEKKINKLAFKEEKKHMDKQASIVNVKGIQLK